MSDIELELEYQRVEPQCATCGRYLDFEEFELYGDYCTECMQEATEKRIKKLVDWEPDSAYEIRKVHGGLSAATLEQMKEAMQAACDDQVKIDKK